MPDSIPTITVRRRWDDPESARVAPQHLRDLVIRNDPGGVCSPIPRPFLFARAWCDHLLEGTTLHTCDPRTAPHELRARHPRTRQSGLLHRFARPTTPLIIDAGSLLPHVPAMKVDAPVSSTSASERHEQHREHSDYGFGALSSPFY
jgi:hypothetical protein